jgi:hypothetical protein
MRTTLKRTDNKYGVKLEAGPDWIDYNPDFPELKPVEL